jgi:hypothetical protein
VSYTNVQNPLTTKNGVPYNLQYNLKTGDVQIIQQNAPAGTRPIYQDGKWNASATELGFTDAEKLQLHQRTILSVQAAYNSVGGVNSGAKLAQWAAKSFSTGNPGQTSVTPEQSVSGTTGGTGGGGVGTIVSPLLQPAEAVKNFAINGQKFGVGNERELFGGLMKYPLDLMTPQQDHFVISQFRYQPSKTEAIFGGQAAALTSLTQGLQPGSNLFESAIGTVFLPMPNNVSDNNSVSWGEDAMSNLAAAATANTLGDVGGKLAAAGVSGLLGELTGIGARRGAGIGLQLSNLAAVIAKGGASPEMSTLLSTELTSQLLKLQGLGVDAESILARGAGIVPNSNLELLFKSPTLRTFTFNYRLSPRSAQEAAMIRRIIRFFKQGMATKKMSGRSGQGSFFLGTPNVFKLEYRSRGKSIDAVNKFKTCALTSFSCNYSPDGIWAAYEQGQPVSTIFNLTFNELEPIYDTDYQDNNIFEGRNDLSSVNSNSVGY